MPEPRRRKDRTPRTKHAPQAELTEFAEWVGRQRRAKPGDEGASPPDPPGDQTKPRVPGSDREVRR